MKPSAGLVEIDMCILPLPSMNLFLSAYASPTKEEVFENLPDTEEKNADTEEKNGG